MGNSIVANLGVKQIILVDVPDRCPICRKSIQPVVRTTYKVRSKVITVFTCPSSKCENFFLYQFSFMPTQGPMERDSYVFHGIHGQEKPIIRKFDEAIFEISESFPVIYNEALRAEKLELNNICGVGYRKAIEFLVKDYAIKFNPEDEEKIKNPKLTLGNCIKQYISDPRIKEMVDRAVWLGNDETHYTRKWDTHNVEDLKVLIDITLHWIQMEVLSKNYESEMPRN